MKIGLIDVDGHNFPNLPLMKLSAWHKQQGDTVEWYSPMFSGHMDRVYMSKIFSFTPNYEYCIDADEVIKGGSGYCIELINGRERWVKEKATWLPNEIEHIYPDYTLYPDLSQNSAYGFLTRGCPCNCSFCHVCDKEGKCSYKVADLSEFWRGQRNIVLLDPNITACKDWKELFQQLIDSKAYIDFTQGLRIHMMTEEKTEMIKRMKVKRIHFAWDNYEDKDVVIPKLRAFKEITGWEKRKLIVYVLVGFNSTVEQDLERIYTLRNLGYWPFVMVYNKDKLSPRHILKQMQRWVNMKAVFETVPRFQDYIDNRGVFK